MRPVLLVHGIWDSAKRIQPLARGLARRGVAHVHAMDLLPRWGNAPLERLAEQVERKVEQVLAETRSDKLDLVGFSMGALVSRTYLTRHAGHLRVRRFVSISGPHAGSLMAYTMPLAGVRQMRPRSDFLRALEGDHLGWTGVSVHCIYSPYDTTVLPGSSGILRGAHSVHSVPVLLHRWMLSDARVLDLVADLLRAPEAPASAPAD
jgi:triacylglycerol esterase/lipase EstA (alpha/beta hydrolase family)